MEPAYDPSLHKLAYLTNSPFKDPNNKAIKLGNKKTMASYSYFSSNVVTFSGR